MMSSSDSLDRISVTESPSGFSAGWPSLASCAKARGGRRLRPLLIAEAANPEWTSVPLVGWNLSRAIADRTDALIVTQIRNREPFLRAGLAEGRDFVAIDNEKTAARLHRLGEAIRGGENRGWGIVTAMSSLAYYSFEREVMRILGKRIEAGEFDLVHRITPLSPTSQSLMAPSLAKMGIPFVIGPLNGGTPWLAAFDTVRRQEKEWLSPWRGLYRWMPGYTGTRTRASAIIAGSRATLQELPALCREKSYLIPENGVDPGRFPFTQRRINDGVLRVAFIGRLVPYKGADILLDAVAACGAQRPIEVLVVGSGPEQKDLENRARAQGLTDRVRFLGWVPQPLLAEALAGAHVLALPSVREFGGGVVLEAMALGLVPVVADYGGPPELIDPHSGVAVAFHDRASLVQGFADALMRFARDPDLLEAMSREAGNRARRDHSWEAKASAMLKIYNRVLQSTRSPCFPHVDKRIIPAHEEKD
jgi:glycosyltransferase involved in cell wall biosynthesis